MNRERKKRNKFWYGDLLKKGKNKIFVWNGCGYSLQTITTHRTEMTIEELAYICIKSGKGSFITLSQVWKEAEEQEENPYAYEDRFYYENECYAYCNMFGFYMQSGYLLIENIRVEGVEIHS